MTHLRKGRPKQRSDRLIKLSLLLESIKAKLFEIYLDIKLNKDELSAENIKNIYLGKGTHDYTILELTDQAIKKYEKELAPGSLKNYSATRAYIQAFCIFRRVVTRINKGSSLSISLDYNEQTVPQE